MALPGFSLIAAAPPSQATRDRTPISTRRQSRPTRRGTQPTDERFFLGAWLLYRLHLAKRQDGERFRLKLPFFEIETGPPAEKKDE